MARPEPLYRFAELTLRPVIALWFNWRFEGREHIPGEGPLLVACNHISYLDPLAHGYMLVKSGRRPRFLAKNELYGNPIMRTLLHRTRQIPVERGSGSHAPVEAAAQALKDGDSVLVYPEGTVTTNADFTPMRGKTGIARLTLTSEVPVLPIAVWGSQHVWQREGARGLPSRGFGARVRSADQALPSADRSPTGPGERRLARPRSCGPSPPPCRWRRPISSRQ